MGATSCMVAKQRVKVGRVKENVGEIFFHFYFYFYLFIFFIMKYIYIFTSQNCSDQASAYARRGEV